MGKVGLKKLSKEVLKKSIDDVAGKLLKTCVFACFPAGTLIQTEHGTKPIEDIQIGDLVWAYDEDTNTTALQPVVDIMQNETDHTISLYTETEVIETTALHPFYTQDGWKDASELKAGDKIKTQNNQEITIESTQFNYEPKKVYNFTVANFHTYFVGVLAWLVHNAGKCLTQLVKKISDDTYDIILKYKEGWSEFQRKSAREKVAALTKANTKVVKNPARKSGTKKTFEKSGGKVKKGEDVDHIQDLQLDGIDDATNMKGLDFSVNRSLGSQIQDRIKNLPEGTNIRNVKIID